MTTHHISLHSAKVKVTGEVSVGTVERNAESWQFFAFVFAACLTLFFGILDELEPGMLKGIALKVLLFFILAYLTLWNRMCRNWLVRLLLRFKKEIY